MQLTARRRELGDAIGANAVRSNSAQDGPLIGVVRGPCYDTCPDGVRGRDQILIYVINVLPQIFCSRGPKRRNGIEVSSNLKHAASDGGENSFHVFYDAVVERVDSAIGPRFANASYDVWLDVPALYLDEDSRP